MTDLKAMGALTASTILEFTTKEFSQLFDNVPIGIAIADFSKLREFIHSFQTTHGIPLLLKLKEDPGLLTEVLGTVRIHYVNNMVLSMFGTGIEELTSSDLEVPVPPQFLKVTREMVSSFLEGQGYYRCTVDLRSYHKQISRLNMQFFLHWRHISNWKYVVITLTDASQRFQIEEALSESERKYRSLFDNLNDVYTRTDIDGKILEISPSVEKHIGFKPEEMIGKDMADFHCNPEDRKGFVAAIAKDGYVDNYEVRIKCKDGSMIYGMASARFHKDDSGEVTGVEAITRNIVHQRALDESRKQYHLIYESSPLGLVHFDMDGKVIDCNDKFVEIIGATREKILDFNALKQLRDKKMLAALKDAYAGKLGDFRGEYTSAQGGKTTWLRVRYKLIESDNGEPFGAMGVFEDITERIHIENELRDSERTIRALLDSTSDTILMMDTEGTVLVTNEGTAERLEHSIDELIGKCIYDFLPPEVAKHRKAKADRVTKTKKPVRFTDGRTNFFLDSMVSPILDESGEVQKLAVFARDITEVVRAEKRYEKLLSSMHAGFALHEIITNDKNEPTDYRFLAVNPAYERITGLKADKITGRTVREILPGTEDCWIQTFGNIAITGEPAYVEEYSKLLDKWFSVSGWSPEPGHFAVTVIDITERKKAEEVLQKAHDRLEQRTTELVKLSESLEQEIEERKRAEKEAYYEQGLMQTLLSNTPDYIYFKDKNRRFVRASNSFCDLFGCGLEDIIGKKDEDLFPEEIAEETASDDRHVIKTGIPLINKEEGGKSIGGGEPWVLTTKLPWRDKKGNIIGLFGISKEITDRKRMEEMLRRRESELTTKSQELEELNAALKVLLKRREKDKEDLQDTVLVNVKELILPYIEKLKNDLLSPQQETLISIIESNIKEIVSPFATKLSSKLLNLTPTELQVASLVKDGRNSNEIAELMNLSSNTILFHRHNIRRKLGLKQRKVNLRSYLKSLQN